MNEAQEFNKLRQVSGVPPRDSVSPGAEELLRMAEVAHVQLKNAILNMLRLQEFGFLLAACPTDTAREKRSSLNPLALTFMS